MHTVHYPDVYAHTLLSQLTCTFGFVVTSTGQYPALWEHGLLHECSLFWLPHHDVQVLHCLPSSTLHQIV